MFTPNPSQIKNILTLRYNPSKNEILPKLDSSDFTPDVKGNVVETVENKIKNGITNFIEKKKPKKVVLALSGGIDSVLSLILLRELYPDLKINCISFGFSEKDADVLYATEIARRFNADFESVFLDNFYENLPKQISIVEEPKINYYWYFVAEKAKQQAEILITGDGGDELFSGYVFRYKKFLNLINKNFTWKEKVMAYLNCHNRDWVDDQEKMFGPVAKFSWDEIYNLLRPHFDNTLGELEQVFLADYNGKLMHDWVPSYQKIYSYLQITGFSPLLDEDLIKHSTHIPTKEKYDFDANIGKLVLRRILQNRKCVLDPDKKGFTPNYPDFWKNHGKRIVKTFLFDNPNIVKDGWINLDWIKSAFRIVNETKDLRYMNKLLHITAFEVWYQLFVTKQLNDHDTIL